jgi:hypothetical protein
MPELLSHQSEVEVFLVLVSVADDQMVGAVGEREDRLELGLAPHLEAHAVFVARRDQRFEHAPLLVHLDRVNERVAAGVLRLLSRDGEPVDERFDSGSNDVRKAEEQREPQPLRLHVRRDLVEVEAAVGLTRGVDGQVALLVDVEVPHAPSLDVVELSRLVEAPGLGVVGQLGYLLGTFAESEQATFVKVRVNLPQSVIG